MCNTHGGKLFEPMSSSANREVAALAGNGKTYGDFIWIGIHDATNEGKFIYESNSQSIGYQNWNSGEPNDIGLDWEEIGEDCVNMYVHQNTGNSLFGKWNDLPCNRKLSFVCEKRKPQPGT